MIRNSIADIKLFLQEIGVNDGDTLLVFSNIQTFGLVENNLAGIFQAVTEVLGSGGTLIVPTFSFSFCNKQEFDYFQTPSAVGVFTNFVLRHADSVRSLHPNHSIAAVGAKAKDVTQYTDKSSFGEGSVFTTMLQYKVKVLSLGVITNTYVHYVEQVAGVPYRYNKDFSGLIIYGDKSWLDTFPMFVRNLDQPGTEEEDREAARQEFFASGISNNLKFGYGIHRLFQADRYCDFMLKKLRHDPYCLVDKNKFFREV